MRIGIIGAGAVGLRLAGHFIDLGHQVTIRVSDRACKALASEKAFRLYDTQSGWTDGYTLDEQFRLAAPFQKLEPQDWIIIATKEQALLKAAQDCCDSGLIGSSTLISPAVNGIPPWFPYKQDRILPYLSGINAERFESFASIVPLEQVVGLSVGFGAATFPECQIRYSSGTVDLGKIHAGQACDRPLEELTRKLSTPKLNFHYTDNIRASVWRKLCLNVLVNAWGCWGREMGNLDNQDLNWGLKLADELCALGLELGVIRPSDKRRIKSYIGSSLNVEDLRRHIPSTWSDVREGRRPEFFSLYGSPLLYLAAVNQKKTCSSSRPLSSSRLRDTYALAVRGMLVFALQTGEHGKMYPVVNRSGWGFMVPEKYDFNILEDVRAEWVSIMRELGFSSLPRSPLLEQISPQLVRSGNRSRPRDLEVVGEVRREL